MCDNCVTIAFFAKSACNPPQSVLGERLAGERHLQRAPVAQLDRAPDYESGGQRFESFRARHYLACFAPSRFVVCFGKSVSKTFSDSTMALSAMVLVCARCLSQISCVRRSEWPVIETISPRRQACGKSPPPLLLHFPAIASLSSVSLKQRSPQRSLMKLDLLIRSCRQHLAPSRKPRTSRFARGSKMKTPEVSRGRALSATKPPRTHPGIAGSIRSGIA